MSLLDNLEHPLMNGAGCVKRLSGVAQMARSAVSAVVVGSITWEPRDGNSGDTFANHGSYSVNALGLPNPGAAYYGGDQHTLDQMIQACEAQQKPLIVSLAGFYPADWHRLFQLCQQYGPHGVELNFGCPNAQDEHPIWSFDPSSMRKIMIDALETMRGIAVGIKLSPFSNPEDLLRAAHCIPAGIDWVTTSNTFPNVMADGLSQNIVYAGMSGASLKPIAMGQVHQLSLLLDQNVKIIGAGGVTRSSDIQEYERHGARCVQATTAYWNAHQNPMVFSDILSR